MFRSARLQLTLWYIVILMLISASFSVVIYKELSNEVERFARMQRLRIERGAFERVFDPSDFSTRTLPPEMLELDIALVDETKQRIIWNLIMLNSGILVIAGGLSYLLAGRTLKPIQEMMDDQHRFISDASHELKTPLTSLKSAFEVYLRDPDRKLKDADGLVAESIEEVNKLHTLSESLLQLAQSQQGGKHVSFELIELQPVLNAAVRQTRAMAKQKKIDVDVDTSNAWVLAHPQTLTQVLVILLDNAIKYSPQKSSVTLKTEQTKSTVTIDIIDRGIGIHAVDLPHIFDRFYRADTARSKEHYNGYGLGLSIAQQLVQLHHGKLTVKSQPGKQTIFSVSLPLAKSA